VVASLSAGRSPQTDPLPDVTSKSAGVNSERWRGIMAAIDDEDRPKKKVAHEVGQDLTLLSAGELTERIALLKGEIARLEADMTKKQAVKSAADSFFKK
jgi:uncharacterized small protein (DUF1192 family)